MSQRIKQQQKDYEIRVGKDGASIEVEVGYDASEENDDFFIVRERVPDFDAQLAAQSQQKEAANQPQQAAASEPEAIAEGGVANQQPEPGEAPFDYADTLNSLRATAEQLPSAQRETLLKAVEQVEQMGQQQDIPEAEQAKPAQQPEPVSAGELVTSAIAQNAPDLDAQLADEAAAVDEAPVPSVDEFRDWYRAARALGKDNQLSRIQTMGELAKEDRLSSISEKDAEQMASDRGEFKEQRNQHGLAQQMIGDARSFAQNLDSLGLVERDGDGTGVVEGNIYTVRENPKNGAIGVLNRETGGKFVANNGGVVEASGLTEEDQARWQKLGASSQENINSQLGKRLQRQPVQVRQEVEL